MSTLARKKKFATDVERFKKEVADLQILDYSSLFAMYVKEFTSAGMEIPADQATYIANVSNGIRYFDNYLKALYQVLDIANKIRELIIRYTDIRSTLNIVQAEAIGTEFVRLLEQLTDLNGRSYFFNDPIFASYNAQYNLVGSTETIVYGTVYRVNYEKIGVDWDMDTNDIFYNLKASMTDNNFNTTNIDACISRLNTEISTVSDIHDRLNIIKLSLIAQYASIQRTLNEYKKRLIDELYKSINGRTMAIKNMNAVYKMTFGKSYIHSFMGNR